MATEAQGPTVPPGKLRANYSRQYEIGPDMKPQPKGQAKANLNRQSNLQRRNAHAKMERADNTKWKNAATVQQAKNKERRYT